MMVIAMIMAATHHPMAAHRPPNTIQSTLSNKAMGDIGGAYGYDGAGTSRCRTHYIEADGNDKHALDPAAAVEARRDYRALSKSGSPDGGTQRTN